MILKANIEIHFWCMVKQTRHEQTPSGTVYMFRHVKRAGREEETRIIRNALPTACGRSVCLELSLVAHEILNTNRGILVSKEATCDLNNRLLDSEGGIKYIFTDHLQTGYLGLPRILSGESLLLLE